MRTFLRIGIWVWCLALLSGGPRSLGQGDSAFVNLQDGDKKISAADKQLLAAHGFFERGHFKFARDEYKAFIEKYPDHASIIDAKYAMAISHYRLNQFEDAVKMIDQVIATNKFQQKAEALAVVGHCHLQLKQYDKALTTFDLLLKDHADSSHAESAALNRAQVLYMVGKKAESLAACDSYIEKFPESNRLDAARYFKALCHHDLKQSAEAEAAATALIEQHPKSRYQLDALYLQGQTRSTQEKFAEAAESFRKMIGVAAAGQQARPRYGLAVALYRTGQYDESISELQTVLKSHGDEPIAAPARFQLGLAQLAAGKVKEAQQTLQQVEQKDEARRNEARYWISQCETRNGRHAEAKKILSDLQSVNPPMANLPQIKFDHAMCQLALSEYKEAADAFAAYRESHGEHKNATQALYYQAFCKHKLKAYDESLKLCNDFAQAGGDATTARSVEQLAAENQFLLGRYGPAAGAFDALLKNASDVDERRRLTLRRGQCSAFQGKHDEAIGFLTTIAEDEQTKKQPALQDAIFVLGDSYLQTEKWADAEKALAGYLAVSKRNQHEATFKLGLAQLRSGSKDEQAKRTFSEVMNGPADSPWVQRAMFEYGQLAYNRKEYDDAKRALTRVIGSKAPEAFTAPSMYLLAWIEFDAKRYKPAANQFQKMAGQFPEHDLAGHAVYQRAMALKLDGQTESALAGFVDYLKKHGDETRAELARYHAAGCLTALKRYDEALTYLEQLAANDASRTDRVLYELAWVHRHREKPADAEAAYRRLIAEHGDSALATAGRAELAELVYANKQYDEAITLITAALADDKIDAKTKAVAEYRLGWCHEQLGKSQEAAAAFESFLKDNPKHALAASAHYQAGEALSRLEKLGEAEKHFDAIVREFPDYGDLPVARIKLGQLQNQSLQYDKAAATFNAFLGAHADSKYRYLAQFGLGWSFENRKQFDEARKWYLDVIDSHNGETAARAQFQIGECYFAEQKFEKAARELLKVESVYDYPSWAARALYEAGRAFEQLKDIEQAKTQYALCNKKYAGDPAAKLAQDRLDALK